MDSGEGSLGAAAPMQRKNLDFGNSWSLTRKIRHFIKGSDVYKYSFSHCITTNLNFGSQFMIFLSIFKITTFGQFTYFVRGKSKKKKYCQIQSWKTAWY